MTGKQHFKQNAKAAGRKRRPLFLFWRRETRENGSVLFYIFIAIGLLGALTLSLVDSGRDGVTTQRAQQITEQLYSQANAIRTVIMGCIHAHPNAIDLDGDGDVDADDNVSPPYPLNPNDSNNPDGAGPDNRAINMQCPGAPAGQYYLFLQDGVIPTNSPIPDPPNGISEWFYTNADESGNRNVYIYNSYSDSDQVIANAVERVRARYSACETSTDTSGSTVYFKIYLKREGCP